MVFPYLLLLEGIKYTAPISKFQCNLCSARYPDAQFLTEHLKVHGQVEDILETDEPTENQMTSNFQCNKMYNPSQSRLPRSFCFLF